MLSTGVISHHIFVCRDVRNNPYDDFHISSDIDSNHVQIIFMDDLAPMKRCFLGIITPTTPHSSPSPKRSMTSQSDSMDRVRLDGDKHYPIANPTDCQEKVPPPSTMVDRLIHHDQDQANSLGGDNSSNAKKSAFGTMPCGKIVRADDETLCEFLLGSKL